MYASRSRNPSVPAPSTTRKPPTYSSTETHHGRYCNSNRSVLEVVSASCTVRSGPRYHPRDSPGRSVRAAKSPNPTPRILDGPTVVLIVRAWAAATKSGSVPQLPRRLVLVLCLLNSECPVRRRGVMSCRCRLQQECLQFCLSEQVCLHSIYLRSGCQLVHIPMMGTRYEPRIRKLFRTVS